MYSCSSRDATRSVAEEKDPLARPATPAREQVEQPEQTVALAREARKPARVVDELRLIVEAVVPHLSR